MTSMTTMLPNDTKAQLEIEAIRDIASFLREILEEVPDNHRNATVYRDKLGILSDMCEKSLIPITMQLNKDGYDNDGLRKQAVAEINQCIMQFSNYVIEDCRIKNISMPAEFTVPSSTPGIVQTYNDIYRLVFWLVTYLNNMKKLLI